MKKFCNEKSTFQEKGYLKIDKFLSKKKILALKKNVIKTLNGHYSTGLSPDKIKKINNKTVQITNCWKSNKYIQKHLLKSQKINKIVCKLMGWKGVKLIEDSIYRIPYKSGGVSVHTDNSYVDWLNPSKLITLWIPLTKINQNSSGIEYVAGSHKKKKKKLSKLFFSGVKYKNLIKDKTTKITGDLGFVVFHHGDILHGSNINKRKNERLAIAMHMCSHVSKFKVNKKHKDWSKFKLKNSNELRDEFFPRIK